MCIAGGHLLGRIEADARSSDGWQRNSLPRSSSTWSWTITQGTAMRGREFLEVAKAQFDVDASPVNWRAAIIHANYALLLECREAMVAWALPPLTRLQVHSQIRLRLICSTD